MTSDAKGKAVLLNLALVFLVAAPGSVVAATPLDELHASPDVAVELSGLVCDDDEVAIDDFTGSVTLTAIGGLPEYVDVDAFHRLPSGELLFSMDAAAELAGVGVVRPGDVVRYDGSSFAREFDGVATGLPAGANVDALGVIGGGDLLLSFDVTIDVVGAIADDEDLVRFDGTDLFLYFDASTAGVDGAQALDAAHHLDLNGHLLMSFSESGDVGGTFFDDEDVVEYDPIAATWTIAYDASAEHGGWMVAGLDALYVVDSSAGAIPNGADVPGPPLRAAKSGSEITLSWSPSCVSSNADYAVYEGLLGDFASVIPLSPPDDCTTGGATELTFTASPGDRFYLVVPQSGQREGSYGLDSNRMERPTSAAACRPQLIGVCL